MDDENFILQTAKYFVELFNLKSTLDIDFVAWLCWLLWPFIITVFLPIIIIILLYMSACIVHIYRLRNYFFDFLTSNSTNNYERARIAVSLLWECHGWIWHGYDLVGIENIPETGSALVVYYHGAIPADYYYMNARVLLFRKRLMRPVVANFLFQLPGLGFFLQVVKAMPGTVSQISELLRDGEIVSVSPGGIRESQFSDENYELIWANRSGFAKAAMLGKAPIIPVFTQNIREAYRNFPPFFKSSFRRIYEKTKLPLLVPYGGFPVKLRTYVGKPIPYDPDATIEELVDKTSKSIKELIRKHQRVPGSIVDALKQRLIE